MQDMAVFKRIDEGCQGIANKDMVIDKGYIDAFRAHG
jgi:hypothetical protein